MAKIHHTAVCCHDVEMSLRFWRDGLGFEPLMDHPFEGDWRTLFGAPSNRLRSIFLGDPADRDSGILELVVFDDAASDRAAEPGLSPPASGFFLVSVACDVGVVLARLDQLGVGGTPREVDVGGVRLVVVTDPDGVLVELMDRPATQNLETLTT